MADKTTPKHLIPQLHGYWDRPPAKDIGDENKERLYRNIGAALTTWENLETVFAMMFGLFVQSESHAAERAYGAIASNSGRRDALENAAEIFLDRKGQDIWNNFRLLLKHWQKANDRRNEIAHSVVSSFVIEGEERGFFLVPASYNSRKTASQTFSWWKQVKEQSPTNPFHVFGRDYRYTSDDIEHFAKRFAVLSQCVGDFFMGQSTAFHQARFDRAPSNQKVAVQLGRQKPSSDRKPE